MGKIGSKAGFLRPERHRVAIVVALALAIALVPARALGSPATNEYKLRLPNAKGKQHDNSNAPVANPSGLPSGVSRQLARDPNGKTLAAIATADELGAPHVTSADTDGDSSLLSALWDPLVLAVALVLLAIGAGARELSRRQLVRQSDAGDQP
jgi:hypothetical protein